MLGPMRSTGEVISTTTSHGLRQVSAGASTDMRPRQWCSSRSPTPINERSSRPPPRRRNGIHDPGDLSGTAVLRRNGIPARVRKSSEGRGVDGEPTVVDLINEGLPTWSPTPRSGSASGKRRLPDPRSRGLVTARPSRRCKLSTRWCSHRSPYARPYAVRRVGRHPNGVRHLITRGPPHYARILGFWRRLTRPREHGPACVGIDPHASLLAQLDDDANGCKIFPSRRRGPAVAPQRSSHRPPS